MRRPHYSLRLAPLLAAACVSEAPTAANVEPPADPPIEWSYQFRHASVTEVADALREMVSGIACTRTGCQLVPTPYTWAVALTSNTIVCRGAPNDIVDLRELLPQLDNR